ncbi:MAG: fructose-1,6-bisphosphate aldolase/phosphatase [Thermodesulfobacteriota bacterium]
MGEEKRITFSVIKADVGGCVGHASFHTEILETARERLDNAKEKGTIKDFHVLLCGDDLELIMTHDRGCKADEVQKLAWNTFSACTELAKKLKLYDAGHDIFSHTFSGSLKGTGCGVAEMEFIERKSEPVIVFMTDKTTTGAWNLPLYRIFADPFNTAGLIMDSHMREGFTFEVLDIREGKVITLACPEESYHLLALIGAIDRYIVRSVYRRSDDEIVATASVKDLDRPAGKYAGNDDPVMIVRCQSGFPAVGEATEPFTLPHLVMGWMRGSHHGPLMPVPFYESNPSRFDGPPRVISAGFQVSNGFLIGPHDMFDDPSFDDSRHLAGTVADYMRRHGPFQPHRLPLEGMESTSLSDVIEGLRKRFKKGE